jgi:hypothetical protein
MAVASRIARLNAAVEAHWGEPITYYDATGASSSTRCVLTSQYDELGIGGSPMMSERRWTGLIDSVDLQFGPEVGDVIQTAAGVRYRVDEPATETDGMWLLVLRTAD